jgi:H/ACA ribonucleoprotein complex subunit 4
VTGVLPVCIRDSARIIEYMHFCGKEYVAVGELHHQVAREALSKALGMFVGEIYQRPPVRSSVARNVRKRTIYYIDELEIEDRRILLRIGCESGTYIRKLIHDLGLVLGVGAHMAELRRTRDGALQEVDVLTLYDVAEAVRELRESKDESEMRKVIRPLEESLRLLPSIYIKDSAVDAICHGASLSVKGISKLDSPFSTQEPVVVKSLKGECVALGRAANDSEWILSAESGMAVKTKTVIMRAGTYPRMWRSHGAVKHRNP